jgi:pteridine reductase
VTAASSERHRAVITGAARRVGAAIAAELAGHGLDLLLVTRAGGTDGGAVQRASHAAAAERGHAIEVELAEVDLAAPQSVAALSQRLAGLPRIDALVHTAASYAPTPFGRVTDEEAVAHFRANALAPLLLTQAAAEPLRRSTLDAGAAVICFGDIHALGRPRRSFSAYGMSKAALGHLVESMARELAPEVRVNGIAPGVVAWPERTSQEEKDRYEARIPLRRSGTPKEAAAMVRWLILEATYLTGTMIRLDGGRWLT